MRKVLSILVLIFLSVNIFSTSINDMNKRIKNIDKEIEKKNTRIKNINTQTSELEKNIKKLEEEIKKLDEDKIKIESEIEIVKKNIDYGEKNLIISEQEHDKKGLEYTAKIIAWDRYSKIYGRNLEKKEILKKHYREVLQGDLNRMEHIEKVTGSIKEVKAQIENEKKKLDKLSLELRENIRKSDSKKGEHQKLIQKLSLEKKGHQTSIVKLKKEKERISKEIERIIRENIRRRAAAEAKKNSTKSTKPSTKPSVPITNSAAYKKIGKTLKPLNGQIVVSFKQKKAGVVESNGIEIKGKVGQNVIASKGGTVIYSDSFQGLGKVVMIDYGSEIIGVYGNLVATKVRLNTKVKAGQSIGALGLSSEKEANLYYELRVNLKPIDPLPTF